MKRTLPWLIGVGSLWIALAFILRHPIQEGTAAVAEAAKEQEAPQAAAQKPGEPSDSGKVVYTFSDDAKMQEFTNLWRQRQGIVLRMTVLQAYWNEEQAALGELNKTFETNYKLDVTKNYTLDDERRVLLERPAPPAPEAAPGTLPTQLPATP